MTELVTSLIIAVPPTTHSPSENSENPGPDYTMIMSKETLHLVGNQTNEQNINLIGKMEFELKVTEQRNSKLKYNINDLENQIKRLQKENEILNEKKAVEVGLFCSGCKDFEDAPMATKLNTFTKKIIQRKNNTISYLTNELYNVPHFDTELLEKKLIYKAQNDLHDEDALIEIKRRNSLLKENKVLQNRLTELNRLFLERTMKQTPQNKAKSNLKSHITKEVSSEIPSGESNERRITSLNKCKKSKISGHKYDVHGVEKDPKITVTTVDPSGTDMCETFIKPEIPMSTLVVLAIINTRSHKQTIQGIFQFISEHFPYFQYTTDDWKKVVKAKLQSRYAHNKFYDYSCFFLARTLSSFQENFGL